MDDGDLNSRAQALRGASETLLIPLACRARGSRDQMLRGFTDPVAERLTVELGLDLERYAVNRPAVLGVIHRGIFFDQVCRDFLVRHPDGAVLNLGAGLNTSYERVREAAPQGEWTWIDTDLAPVIALRERLFTDDARRSTRVLDACDDAAMQAQLEQASGPLLIVSEGVLMYLGPDQVAAVFRAAGDRGGSEFVFDWVSATMMRNSRKHPSLKRLRDESVVFSSSLKRASDIAQFHPGWRIKTQTSAPMTRSGLAPAAAAFLFSILTFGRRYYGCAHAILR